MTLETPTECALREEDLEDRPQEIIIDKILRLLPGKRLVALTDWQGRSVIAKLFYHKRRWLRHLRREMAGFKLAQDAELPVPKVLASGNIANQQGGFLIIEYLESGNSLEALLDSHDSDLDTYISRALQLIARCHEQGLWQNDIHLGNFMAKGDAMYLLDSAEFKSEDPGIILSDPLRLANLSLFFAQFSVYRDSRIPKLMQSYNEQLAPDKVIVDAADMPTLTMQARHRRLDRYQTKLFRETSAFHTEQNANLRMLCKRSIMSEELSRFIENPDEFLERGTILKAGNTTTVGEVSIAGTSYVLKRYNIKSTLHGVRKMLRASRAARSWRAGLLLEMLGVSTAKPLVMLEKRIWGLIRRESYILYERVDGETVPQVLSGLELSAEVRDRIFASFKQCFEVMRRCKLSHGDLKASNFIFANDELILLDLDATILHVLPWTFKRAFRKDLERFVKNFSSDSTLKEMEPQAQDVVRTISG
ncbi:MAG: phosphotransferase [Gammaproteobacteria bacterium]|nr:phosphotransferase [Gammaproteobacteria bacterium]